MLFAVVLDFGDDGTLEATFTVVFVVVDCFPLLDDDEPFTALDESSLLVALRLDGGEPEIGVDGDDEDCCCSFEAANRRLDDDESFLDELLLQVNELINGFILIRPYYGMH